MRDMRFCIFLLGRVLGGLMDLEDLGDLAGLAGLAGLGNSQLPQKGCA